MVASIITEKTLYIRNAYQVQKTVNGVTLWTSVVANRPKYKYKVLYFPDSLY